MISLPFSYIFSFFWEWSNLTWFPTCKPRRGGSALSCNIDKQSLITIITAVLSNVVWTCDTSVCLNSPFNFKNKRFNFAFLYLLFLCKVHIFSFLTGLMLDFIFFKNLKGLSHQLFHLSFQKHYQGGVCVNPLFMEKLKHREVPLSLVVFQSLPELRID